MASEKKKSYMKKYNKQPKVKAKKAAYMQRMRALKDKESARNLIRTLLDFGFEKLAFQYALERAPEMLVTAKVRRR